MPPLPPLLILWLACTKVGPSTSDGPMAEPALPEEAAPASAPVPSPAAPDCASLDEAGCLANHACAPIRGLAAETAEALARNEQPPEPPVSVFFSCMAADSGGCKEVETYASAGPGQPCYVFGDSCTPPGWVPCKP